MPKIKEVKIIGYGFRGYDGLFWHSNKFWFNDKELKKVYNNGSLCLVLYGSKKSIKQLRKLAYKCEIIIYSEPLPF